MSGINVLSDLVARNARPRPKMYKLRDGGNLFLVIYPSGTKTWRYLWKIQGKPHQYTIGAYPAVSLKKARQERDRIAGLIVVGVDPNDEKKYRISKVQQEDQKKALTFERVAREWYDNKTVSLTQRSLGPLRTMEATLSGLQFIEPRVAQAAQLIRTALDEAPDKGPIQGTDLSRLLGLVCLLRDSEALEDYTTRMMEGQSASGLLEGLAATGQQTYAEESVTPFIRQSAVIASQGLW